MKKKDFSTPDFLICEEPIKNKDNDRIWIYAVKHLTLIECIYLNNIEFLSLNVPYFEFNYKKERWALALTQNNIEPTDGNVTDVVNSAWIFFKNYLNWEDNNIDNNKKAKLN